MREEKSFFKLKGGFFFLGPGKKCVCVYKNQNKKILKNTKKKKSFYKNKKCTLVFFLS